LYEKHIFEFSLLRIYKLHLFVRRTNEFAQQMLHEVDSKKWMMSVNEKEVSRRWNILFLSIAVYGERCFFFSPFLYTKIIFPPFAFSLYYVLGLIEDNERFCVLHYTIICRYDCASIIFTIPVLVYPNMCGVWTLLLVARIRETFVKIMGIIWAVEEES